MSNLQAPRINAAVPVQTPLFVVSWFVQITDKAARKCHNPGIRPHQDLHQPLQRREFDSLELLPQHRCLLLNPSLRLLELELLHVGLFPDASLLQIQVQPHARLCALYLVPQPAVQLGDLVGKTLVRRARQRHFGRIGREQLGAQLREVDFLRVRRPFLIFTKDHCAREILYAGRSFWLATEEKTTVRGCRRDCLPVERFNVPLFYDIA